MVKSYACAGILLFAIGLFPLMAQDNTVAQRDGYKDSRSYCCFYGL